MCHMRFRPLSLPPLLSSQSLAKSTVYMNGLRAILSTCHVLVTGLDTISIAVLGFPPIFNNLLTPLSLEKMKVAQMTVFLFQWLTEI